MKKRDWKEVQQLLLEEAKKMQAWGMNLSEETMKKLTGEYTHQEFYDMFFQFEYVRYEEELDRKTLSGIIAFWLEDVSDRMYRKALKKGEA